ncbi:RNA-binding protein 7 [Halyomorpha halys]|uniref:RNA-binding protein 7 n=1 Tax=Halyomorpha halys TaxID=286706 RepID=UPI0006D51B86|nr:RNA-binding protein 7 [Halyomorpha halys]
MPSKKSKNKNSNREVKMMSQEETSVLVRNLDEKVTEELLYELFLQAGPLEDVRIPQVNGVSRNFGFIVFTHEESVPYAIALLDQISLYGRTIYLKYAGANNYQNAPYRGPPPRSHIKDRLGPRPSENNANSRGAGQHHSGSNASLRGAPGSIGRRYNDLSMQPTRPSKNRDSNSDNSRQRNAWAQPMPGNYLNIYPSQKGDDGIGRNMNNYSNNNFKQKGRHSSGESNKPYEKAPYQRDSNRYHHKHCRRSK